ncbi:hypothetical protein MRX96_035898 [Rhipicephalus microplus]
MLCGRLRYTVTLEETFRAVERPLRKTVRTQTRICTLRIAPVLGRRGDYAGRAVFDQRSVQLTRKSALRYARAPLRNEVDEEENGPGYFQTDHSPAAAHVANF